MVVAPKDADNILGVLKAHTLGKDSVIIGEITESNPCKVLMQTEVGGRRIIDMLAGEMLPRIC
jgi:hydrogenase expression/formation protein HypE